MIQLRLQRDDRSMQFRGVLLEAGAGVFEHRHPLFEVIGVRRRRRVTGGMARALQSGLTAYRHAADLSKRLTHLLLAVNNSSADLVFALLEDFAGLNCLRTLVLVLFTYLTNCRVIEPLTLVLGDAITVFFRPLTPSFPAAVGHGCADCTANAESAFLSAPHG